jgi:hypothetical protein
VGFSLAGMASLLTPRRPFDRRTGGKKPFDPRAFEVLASLTASRPRSLFSPHQLLR